MLGEKSVGSTIPGPAHVPPAGEAVNPVFMSFTHNVIFEPASTIGSGFTVTNKVSRVKHVPAPRE